MARTTDVRATYAHARTEREFGDKIAYPVRDSAYVEDEQPGPYSPPEAPYAQGLAFRLGATPDPQRVMREPITDARVAPTKPRSWWGQRAAERAQRESVGTWWQQLPEQRSEDAGAGGQRFVRRAGEVPPPNNRYTANLAPESGGRYMRPFTGRTPHRFNGVHSSRADLKRMDATIYGMAAPRTARSTVRQDIVSWGEDRRVVQAPTDVTPNQTSVVLNPNTVVSRSMRLV